MVVWNTLGYPCVMSEHNQILHGANHLQLLKSNLNDCIAILMCSRCQLAIYTFRVSTLIYHIGIYLRITNDNR